MEFVAKLRQRVADGNPISVRIVGCGQMGSGLANTLNEVAGMQASAIADIEPQRAIDTFADIGYPKDQLVITEEEGKAQDAIREGRPLVTADALLLARLDGLDANVEATGVPDIGALFAWTGISTGKPVIMLNVETDISVGLVLNHLSRKSGSLYTVASVDEPGVLKMLYEQAMVMGFDVACLAKGQVNKIDFGANPETAREEALSRGINPRMLAEFKDGTKTAVEMCAVSNATGLPPGIPGMHRPESDVDELVGTFIPKEDGGVLSARGRVDYSTGKVAPGVFAIVYTDVPRTREQMKYHTGTDGPYYLQLRPYHLCEIETPQSIAEAVLLGERTVTSNEPVSEVVCAAKRDLKAGQVVEGIGGKDWRGMIMRHDEATAMQAVPIGVGAGATMLRDLRAGEVITREAMQPDRTKFVYKLREMQDALLAHGVLRPSSCNFGSTDERYEYCYDRGRRRSGPIDSMHRGKANHSKHMDRSVETASRQTQSTGGGN